VTRQVREPFDLIVGVEIPALGLFENSGRKGVTGPSFRCRQQVHGLILVNSDRSNDLYDARLPSVSVPVLSKATAVMREAPSSVAAS